MDVVTKLLQALLMINFVVSAVIVMRPGDHPIRANIRELGISSTMLIMIAGVQLLAGALLLVGFLVPMVSVLGAALLVATMLGAVGMHLLRENPSTGRPFKGQVALVFLVLSAALLWLLTR